MAARVGKYLLFETLGEGAFGKYVFFEGARAGVPVGGLCRRGRWSCSGSSRHVGRCALWPLCRRLRCGLPDRRLLFFCVWGGAGGGWLAGVGGRGAVGVVREVGGRGEWRRHGPPPAWGGWIGGRPRVGETATTVGWARRGPIAPGDGIVAARAWRVIRALGRRRGGRVVPRRGGVLRY